MTENQADPEEAFSIGCLMRADLPLSTVTAQPPEVWEDYEVVEAMLDSGAGECVCGPQHFSQVDMTVDPNRASAGTEYICADGARASATRVRSGYRVSQMRAWT